MWGTLISAGVSAAGGGKTGQPGASMGLPSMGSSASSSLKSSGGVHFYEGKPLAPPPIAAGMAGAASRGELLQVGIALGAAVIILAWFKRNK